MRLLYNKYLNIFFVITQKANSFYLTKIKEKDIVILKISRRNV